MSKKIEVEFAFEIGDLVYIRGADYTVSVRPNQFVILERSAQECHAGIQRCYKLLEMSSWVPEIALTYDEPAYRPASDAWLADRLRVQAAERKLRMEETDLVWQREEKRQAEYDRKKSPKPSA